MWGFVLSSRRFAFHTSASSLDQISSNTASTRRSRLIVVFSSFTSFGSSSSEMSVTARRSRCLDRDC